MSDLCNEYFINGTKVLKNKLGINDATKLAESEKVIFLKKLTYLNLFPIHGEFDCKHLKAIPRFLFDEVYPFAGEYRKCMMTRFRDFVVPEEIEESLTERLEQMNEHVKNIQSVDEYAYFLAPLYYDLMVIHPFRDESNTLVKNNLLFSNWVMVMKYDLYNWR